MMSKKTVLIPYLNYSTANMYKSVLTSQDFAVTVILISDYSNVDDYLLNQVSNKSTVIMCSLDEYAHTVNELLASTKFDHIAPVFLDIHQHLFGLPKFCKFEILNDLQECGFLIPNQQRSPFLDFFPVIAKPNDGSGSLGVFKSDSLAHLIKTLTSGPPLVMNNADKYFFQQFIQGDVVTVSCIKYNGDVKIVASYDINFDQQYFTTVERAFPSRHVEILNDSLLTPLKTLSAKLNNLQIVTLDVIVTESKQVFVIDVCFRLPLSELSGFLFDDFCKHLIFSNVIDLPRRRLHQKYKTPHQSQFQQGANILLDCLPKNHQRKKYWNTRILNASGFVISGDLQ